MNISDIIDSHRKYGTTKTDIVSKSGYLQVLDFVVVAPWWEYSIFEKFSDRIENVADKVYNIYGKDFQFTFIQIKNIGAPALLESVLPLALTKCKRIVFIGSVGALNNDIKIGDLVVPKYSINGVGACRFLNKDLTDDFEEKFFPSLDFNAKMLSVLKENYPQFKVHEVVNYSVDTIFAQFAHIEHFLDLKCKTIEMETSALFKCGEVMNIETAALLCVSDNTLNNKSLYSGRNDDERKIKKEMKNNHIPKIIIEISKLFNYNLR